MRLVDRIGLEVLIAVPPSGRGLGYALRPPVARGRSVQCTAMSVLMTRVIIIRHEGFADPSHLARVFRRHTGMTPAHARGGRT